jgi:hypothetical protein
MKCSIVITHQKVNKQFMWMYVIYSCKFRKKNYKFRIKDIIFYEIKLC